MDDELLDALEAQTDTLITAFELKLEENAALRRELNQLKQQQGSAQEKIQSMIQRLKLIETQA